MVPTVAHSSSKLSPKWKRRIMHLQELSQARVQTMSEPGKVEDCFVTVYLSWAFLDEKSCDHPDETLARGPLTLPGIERRTADGNYGALKSQTTYETYPCPEVTQKTNNTLAGLGTSHIVERTFWHSFPVIHLCCGWGICMMLERTSWGCGCTRMHH